MLNPDHHDGPRACADALLGELRLAVLGGRWDQVAALCASMTPAVGTERLLLDQLAGQAELHACADRVLRAGHPAPGLAAPGLAAPGLAAPGLAAPGLAAPGLAAPGLPGPAAGLTDASRQLTRALRRSLAALGGDRAQAAALFRQHLPVASSLDPDWASLPRRDVGCVTLPWQTRGLQRVIGVARPLADGAFAIGDAASPEALPVAGVGDAVARGTPIEVVGRWNGGRRIVECRSLATIGQVPDYPGICAAVENLCARAGLAAEPMQLRLRPPGELDQSVVQARDKRRLGEWDATLAAAELLDHALSAGQLSLEALARVHAIVVGASSARAGQLRQTPAVIRWCGVITCRTPPVPAARSQARGYLSDLAAELRNGASGRHPATLAAEAIAFLTASHPFADGNGRVSRALATWLLLRSGFRRRADNTLGTFLDAHLDEHYRALRNFRVSPWGWHQLFYDAVLATFERAPAPVAV